jgi:putative (di)nucleoside polyphosphate hydrolase
MTADDHLYRRGVGVMLLNGEGKVFVAARIDNPDDAWQMPQGGMDEGEDPWATALRELEEETGIPPHLVERLAECPERLRYDLPEELQGQIWGGKWKGQVQHWFLCRFLGRDSDVRIDSGDHPEFREWTWIDAGRLPEVIVPFKRELYRRLLRDFSPWLGGSAEERGDPIG